MKRSERFVPLALGIAIVSISFAAIFLKKASPTHPLVIAGTRLAIAAVVLAVPTIRAWRAGRLPRNVVRTGVVCGVLYGAHFGTWVTSLSMTSVASSVTLVTATPLLLALLALVSGKDRPTRRSWAAIGFALLGLTLIGWADLSLSTEALLGDGLALAGAVAIALYLQLVRGLGKTLDVLAFSGLTTSVGALTLLSCALVARVPIVWAGNESLLWIALAALIPQLVGHNLLTWSLRHASPTMVGISTVGEPIGASFLAWAWLGEDVGWLVAIGCAITLGAVAIALGRPTHANHPQPETGESPRAAEPDAVAGSRNARP